MPSTILIVDDEETLSHFLGQSLEAEGYCVLRAATAQEGLRILSSQQVDLLLLDMRLPDLDGTEVLRRMPRAGEKPWVIVLTSDGGSGQARGTEIREEVMRLGAQAYLEKPLDLGVLKETIAGILDAETRKPPIRKRVEAVEKPPQAAVARPAAGEQTAEIRRLKKRIEELEQLQTLSETLAQAQEVSQVADAALAAVQNQGIKRAALWVWVGSRQKYILVAAKNILGGAAPTLEGEEISRRLVAWSRSKEPLLLQDDDGQAFASWLGLSLAPEPACLFPLHFEEKPCGVLFLSNPPGRPFSSSQLSRLSALASPVGQALGRVLMVEQLRAQRQELLAEAARQSAALAGLPFGVLVGDGEGRIVLANPAAERLLGYSAGGLLGQALGTVLGGSDPGEAWQQGVFLAHRQAKVRGKSGTEIALEVDFSLQRDESGAITGLVAALREPGVAEAEEDKADWGQISRILAHEIRNPLAGIGAGVQHLLSKLPPEDSQRESLELILREADRINRIIEEILTLTRPISLNFGGVNIALVLDEALQVNQGRLSSELRIEKSLAKNLPLIHGDAQRLRQALANILQAAAQNGGGVLHLAAVVREEEIEIEIRGPRPMQKSGEMTSATGLGLAAARRIIEAHGGELDTESDGFIVRLPVSRDRGERG